MNELQRTQYLEEMGIEVFVPRFLLPSAKESTQAVLPVADNVDTVVSLVPAYPQVDGIATELPSLGDKPIVPQKVSGVLSNILGVLDGGSDDRKAPVVEFKEVASEPEDTTATVNEVSESVSFSLSLWRVSDSLLVIDSRSPKQALPTSALLTNMLIAKGIKQRLPTPEVLTWPMIEYGDAAGDWSQASEMVNAFLSARLSIKPTQYIWLMGESAYKSIAFDDNQDYSQKVGAALDLSSLSSLAIVLPSLSEILLKPELKRQVWNAIRPYNVV